MAKETQSECPRLRHVVVRHGEQFAGDPEDAATLVRQIAEMGGDISAFVPAIVLKALRKE